MVRDARWASLLIGVALLAGCKTTSSPAPQQAVVRSGGETAPAELQLACASEAATRLNAGNSVLPLSSVRDPSGVYRVSLQLSAGQAVCVIDQSGVIQSIGPA
jgi:hypothetical protein